MTRRDNGLDSFVVRVANAVGRWYRRKRTLREDNYVGTPAPALSTYSSGKAALVYRF